MRAFALESPLSGKHFSWLHAYEGDLLDAAKVLDLTEDGNIVAIRGPEET